MPFETIAVLSLLASLITVMAIYHFYVIPKRAKSNLFTDLDVSPDFVRSYWNFNNYTCLAISYEKGKVIFADRLKRYIVGSDDIKNWYFDCTENINKDLSIRRSFSMKIVHSFREAPTLKIVGLSEHEFEELERVQALFYSARSEESEVQRPALPEILSDDARVTSAIEVLRKKKFTPAYRSLKTQEKRSQLERGVRVLVDKCAS